MHDLQDDNAGVIAPPPLIYAGPLLLGHLLRPTLPGIPLPRGARRLLGALLVAGGAGVAAWGFRTMSRAGTPVDPSEPVRALVSEGPFQFSRNPLYLSLTLTYGGISLLTNTLSALVLLPGVLTVMQRGVIGREEEYLERRFDTSYRQYKGRVRRWF